MSVFISYRRSASKHLARLIFEKLRARGFDVFLDVTTIDSGAFDRIILNQIAARPHFLLILSSGSLERCADEGDWLRREIEEAFRLQRNIVPVFDEGFNIEAEKQFLPEPIRSDLPRLNAPPYSHYYFDAFIDTICNRFLKQPVYDVPISTTPTGEQAEVQRRIEQAAASSPASPPQPETSVGVARSKVYDVLPKPFEWIDIPAGKVTLINTWDDKSELYLKKNQSQEFDVPAFSIAKYPVTVWQFMLFLQDYGYINDKWWTKLGWQAKTEGKWVDPLDWRKRSNKNRPHPIIGVSWYEALAFCRWLGGGTGENILLPTEQQWQRAAQGDDGRVYPWGNDWDCQHCNNSVKPCTSISTSSITDYEGEGKGISPYGVADMSGNVWEWCLTEYYTGQTTVEGNDTRVLRGGAWNNDNPLDFRADHRIGGSSKGRNDMRGFRLARTY
jgi:formylglycine-generating enzyme required for sulfatase activity